MHWLSGLRSGLGGWAPAAGAFHHLGFTLLNFLTAFRVFQILLSGPAFLVPLKAW